MMRRLKEIGAALLIATVLTGVLICALCAIEWVAT